MSDENEPAMGVMILDVRQLAQAERPLRELIDQVIAMKDPTGSEENQVRKQTMANGIVTGAQLLSAIMALAHENNDEDLWRRLQNDLHELEQEYNAQVEASIRRAQNGGRDDA